MKSYHPDPFTHVDISHRDWIRLGMAALEGKPEWQIVEQAIDEWMRRHDANNCGEPEFSGYQWKGLFLPHDTVLRTVFKGKNYHCRVEGDQIMYAGQARSPSGFVNAVGGVRRNAWKSVWVLLPDSKHWQLADTLRAPRRPAGARRGAHTARAAKVAAATAATATAAVAPPVKAAAPTPEVGVRFAVPLATQYRWCVRPESMTRAAGVLAQAGSPGTFAVVAPEKRRPKKRPLERGLFRSGSA